jgi:hypothetical protein
VSPPAGRFPEIIAKLEAVATARKQQVALRVKYNEELRDTVQGLIRAKADQYSAGLQLLYYKHYLVTELVEPSKVNGFSTRIVISVADEHNDMLHPEVSLMFKVSKAAKLVAIANGIPFEPRISDFASLSLGAEITATIDDFTEIAMMKILADPAID